MIATIKRIHQLKQARSDGAAFYRVEFRFFDARERKWVWLKTDLVTRYRNWANWRHLLRVGNKIGNLRLKKGTRDTVDADSRPTLIGYEPEEEAVSTAAPAPVQMAML